jgi:hypothetical protein
VKRKQTRRRSSRLFNRLQISHPLPHHPADKNAGSDPSQQTNDHKITRSQLDSLSFVHVRTIPVDDGPRFHHRLRHGLRYRHEPPPSTPKMPYMATSVARAAIHRLWSSFPTPEMPYMATSVARAAIQRLWSSFPTPEMPLMVAWAIVPAKRIPNKGWMTGVHRAYHCECGVCGSVFRVSQVFTVGLGFVLWDLASRKYAWWV